MTLFFIFRTAPTKICSSISTKCWEIRVYAVEAYCMFPEYWAKEYHRDSRNRMHNSKHKLQ